MVEWKGRLDSDAGAKARKLDEVENFNVPNFFVITSEELSSIFSGKNSRQQILNASISSDHEEQIKDAYKEIGMSSEVRNANGRAKNLVGGQRNNQLVSVRVSSEGRGYRYRLNVGSSDLVDAIKQVSASYYEKEGEQPSIIIQKMVEPDYSGAAMKGSLNQPDLVEVVEGLGTSLEEGKNYPYLYVEESGELETRVPSQHKKVTRNPINGRNKEKEIEPQLPFEKSKIKEMLGKLDSESSNIKFVYKRGDFYVVDAWEDDNEYEVLEDSTIQGIKVSSGQINGVVGRDILYTEGTTSPENYDTALVARQGGYTSRDAEAAREAGKPAVFGFARNLSNGQRINMSSGQEKQTRADRHTGRSKDRREPEFVRENGEEEKEEESAANRASLQVLPINPREGEGVYLSPPFGEGIAVTDRRVDAEKVSEGNYLDSYHKIFTSDGEKTVLDARKLEKDGLEEAMDYLEAEKMILLVSKPDVDLLKDAVAAGFDVFGTEERYVEVLKEELARAENRFVIEKLREKDSN